jgi:hypothetical protein
MTEQAPYERRCIEAWNLVQSHGGDIPAAALASGTPERTLRDRVKAARPFVPTESQDEPAEPVQAVSKPRVRVPYHRQDRPPDGPVIRVLGIGDVHKKPGRTDEPIILAARHAAETRPDYVAQIGDWLSLDSCSFHPAKGSAKDSNRPSFASEIEAGEESLDAFDRNCPHDIRRLITLGNHEHRAWRVADADPRLAGDFPLRVEQLFARYRWQTHLYGKMAYIGGVGLIHVPLNQMGREYGGKNSENAIGNDATHSLIWGHDHRFRSKTVPKIGPNNKISLCNLGTNMPHGVVEDYNVGLTGWTYGVVDIRIQGGLIVSAKFHDQMELKERYGD